MQESNANLERVSRRREKRKKMSMIKVMSIALVCLVLIYLIAAIFVSVRSNLSTTVANSGIIRETVRTRGYVFRQQTIINSPSGGYLECVVAEGERVKEGQVLGYVYAIRPDAAIMEQIKNLHKEIRSRGFDTENIAYTSSPATAEKRISVLTRDMSDMRQDCDLRKIVEVKDRIDTLVSRKQSDGEELTVKSVEQLEAELASLLSQSGGGRAIIASAGGVFTSRIDGFEDALAYDKAMTVTPSYLRELSDIKTEVSQTVDMGQPLCKIVNNYSWYLAAEIDDDIAENIVEGQNIQIELFDLSNTAITGRVARVSDSENGKRALVISTNKYVDGIYSSSRIDADVVLVSSEGIKLPTQCLHVKDGVTGVYVLRLDVARFVPVHVKYKNDEWSIVSPAEAEIGSPKLQIYDEVIVACRNLEDGKVIR